MDPVAAAARIRGPEFQVGLEDRGGSTKAPATGGADFGAALVDSLGKLDAMQLSADQQGQALATGKAQDIAAVVTEVERAALAMQLAVQVRNRAVEAYHELFRMQV
jgi:flagellar hook-basal body complex protein FliE